MSHHLYAVDYKPQIEDNTQRRLQQRQQSITKQLSSSSSSSSFSTTSNPHAHSVWRTSYQLNYGNNNENANKTQSQYTQFATKPLDRPVSAGPIYPRLSGPAPDRRAPLFKAVDYSLPTERKFVDKKEMGWNMGQERKNAVDDNRAIIGPLAHTKAAGESRPFALAAGADAQADGRAIYMYRQKNLWTEQLKEISGMHSNNTIIDATADQRRSIPTSTVLAARAAEAARDRAEQAVIASVVADKYRRQQRPIERALEKVDTKAVHTMTLKAGDAEYRWRAGHATVAPVNGAANQGMNSEGTGQMGRANIQREEKELTMGMGVDRHYNQRREYDVPRHSSSSSHAFTGGLDVDDDYIRSAEYSTDSYNQQAYHDDGHSDFDQGFAVYPGHTRSSSAAAVPAFSVSLAAVPRHRQDVNNRQY